MPPIGPPVLSRATWSASQTQAVLEEARDEVVVLSPFVTFPGMRALNSACKSVETRLLLVRWRLADLLAGASDTAAVRMALGAGWNVRRNSALHAKVILADSRQAIIGSANVTATGLGLDGQGNFECTALVLPTEGFYRECIDLHRGGIEINLSIIEAVDAQVRELDRSGDVEYSESVFDQLFPRASSWLGCDEGSWPPELAEVEFPQPPSAQQKALLCEVFERFCIKNELSTRDALLESEVVEILFKSMMGDIGFGPARQVLRFQLEGHRWCRISHTTVTQALFAWLAQHLPDVVVSSRPRYREVLRRVGPLVRP